MPTTSRKRWNSVRAQALADVDLVVVDDCSTDDFAIARRGVDRQMGRAI